jgi:monoamine oxidase
VGADGAQQALAAPVENTLFFAGEATDTTGNNGTVHGAIASGQRAAREIIETRGV